MPGGAHYFSLLDLKDAFFFILLHSDSHTFLPLNGRNLTLEALGQCFLGAFWRAPISLEMH